jgi:hypothetical protein
MKWSPAWIAVFCVVLISDIAVAATLTTDPITGLPLDPATNSRLNLGNEPTKIPVSAICNSKTEADFYSVYSPIDETIAWYTSHLKEFKHAHAYSGGRSRDTFYNSGGTIIVTVTGEPGQEGMKVDTHAVVYYTLQPGISEKAILAMLHEKIVRS